MELTELFKSMRPDASQTPTPNRQPTQADASQTKKTPAPEKKEGLITAFSEQLGKAGAEVKNQIGEAAGINPVTKFATQNLFVPNKQKQASADQGAKRSFSANRQIERAGGEFAQRNTALMTNSRTAGAYEKVSPDMGPSTSNSLQLGPIRSKKAGQEMNPPSMSFIATVASIADVSSRLGKDSLAGAQWSSGLANARTQGKGKEQDALVHSA